MTISRTADWFVYLVIVESPCNVRRKWCDIQQTGDKSAPLKT
jgi:hypothetical protein